MIFDGPAVNTHFCFIDSRKRGCYKNDNLPFPADELELSKGDRLHRIGCPGRQVFLFGRAGDWAGRRPFLFAVKTNNSGRVILDGFGGRRLTFKQRMISCFGVGPEKSRWGLT